MAHVEKYGRSAIGHMLDHYARECEATLERDNVHESETGRNYALAYSTEGDMGEFTPRQLKRAVKNRITKAVQVHEQNTGKKLRKDGVVMCDAVVTLPEDWPEDRDPQQFFMVALAFVKERYGSRCVNGGFVHMDETTPHMHIPIIPLIDPEGTDKPRLCAKKKICRSDLRSFHKDFQACLREHGLPGTVGGLRRDGMPKWTSKLTQDELQDYKDSLEQAKREGIALGRSQSRSKESDLQNRVNALEKENEGLRASLVVSQEQAHNAAKGVNEMLKEKNEMYAKLRAAEAQLADTRKVAAAKPVRSGAYRKPPAQPVVEAPSEDDGYSPW